MSVSNLLVPNNYHLFGETSNVIGGTGITVTSMSGTDTVSITPTGVTAGTYTNPASVQVNAEGQILAISSGTTTILPYFEYERTTSLSVAEATSTIINSWDSLISMNGIGSQFNSSTGVFTANTALAGSWIFGVKGAYSSATSGGSGLTIFYNLGTTNLSFDNIIADNATIDGYRLVTATQRLSSGDTIQFNGTNIGTGAGAKTLLATNPVSLRCWAFKISS